MNGVGLLESLERFGWPLWEAKMVNTRFTAVLEHLKEDEKGPAKKVIEATLVEMMSADRAVQSADDHIVQCVDGRNWEQAAYATRVAEYCRKLSKAARSELFEFSILHDDFRSERGGGHSVDQGVAALKQRIHSPNLAARGRGEF